MYKARKTPLGYALYFVTGTTVTMVGNDFYTTMAAAKADAKAQNERMMDNLRRAGF